jgi:sugar phosphate isomerase/epimerase
MTWTRRELLAAGAGSLAGLLAKADPGADAARPSLGVVIHSYGNRKANDKERHFDAPLTFVDYCRTLGASGAQTSLGVRDEAYAAKMRDLLAAHQLYLEGSLGLPRDRDDVERFSAEVQSAKRCGAKLFRTVLMSGRRYEAFDSVEAYHKVFEASKQSLALARPIVEKHEVRMAVENHKDLQAPDLLDLIKKLDSPLVGVCLDTGNNLSLLETPQETVDLLAPHAFTTHIKDMGVEEYAEGFLLAEVPLGMGFLDLPKLIATVRKARPQIALNLEMITRDPLKIPCLTPKYWVTLGQVPGRRLAEILALVRSKASKKPLPRISELSKEEQIQREDDNVRQCLRFARANLE